MVDMHDNFAVKVFLVKKWYIPYMISMHTFVHLLCIWPGVTGSGQKELPVSLSDLPVQPKTSIKERHTHYIVSEASNLQVHSL
jgi:hypothetical protein